MFKENTSMYRVCGVWFCVVWGFFTFTGSQWCSSEGCKDSFKLQKKRGVRYLEVGWAAVRSRQHLQLRFFAFVSLLPTVLRNENNLS